MKITKGNISTQQLIGIKSFTANGVLTESGELVFFIVKPTNISVLSRESIAVKVRHLMQLLSAQPDIEICCIDDKERLDDNKAYIENRIADEKNLKLRELLDLDRQFLDEIQTKIKSTIPPLAVLRQFMFIVRIRNESAEQSFANLNRIQKSISEQGFDVHRAEKEEIKRFLTLYFLRQLPCSEIPDTDGEDIVQKWMIPD